jgi:hypothetical protein
MDVFPHPFLHNDPKFDLWTMMTSLMTDTALNVS